MKVEFTLTIPETQTRLEMENSSASYKIHMIKGVRLVTGISLKDARDIVEDAISGKSIVREVPIFSQWELTLLQRDNPPPLHGTGLTMIPFNSFDDTFFETLRDLISLAVKAGSFDKAVKLIEFMKENVD